MTVARYTRTAIALHWLIAVAILANFALGLYMHGLAFSPLKLQMYAWHKWAGVSVFVLVAVRLVWRLAHRPPALPQAMPGWQQAAARLVHWLLYALMFAVPLTGWLMSSAKGFQTVYFGVLPIPDLLAKDPDLGNTLAEVHEALNFLMLAIVLGHAAAALKHHWFDRDEVLASMLPALGANAGAPPPPADGRAAAVRPPE